MIQTGGGRASRTQPTSARFFREHLFRSLFSEYTLSLSLSLSLSSQANRIKHKRSLKWNYPPHRKIRKHFTAPLPKHFQNLLKFKLQNTKKFQISKFFLKNFLISLRLTTSIKIAEIMLNFNIEEAFGYLCLGLGLCLLKIW
jgi:hypothetical protein